MSIGRLRRYLGLYDTLLQDGTGHSLTAKSARLPSPCDHDSRLWSALSPFDRPTPQRGTEGRNFPITRRSDDSGSQHSRKTLHLSHTRAGPSRRRHTALQAHDQQTIVLPLGKNPIATIQALTKSLAPRTSARRPTIRRTKGRRTGKNKMVRPSEIRISHDSQTWASAAAELVHEVGQEAVRANGQFLIALSGGTTPETLYRALASPAFADRFYWSRTTFFFSDEHCVPLDDPRSNYALAHRALFIPLKIASSQVYRMAEESRDPQAAAYEYEQQLRRATKTSPSAQPSLDLILLGLGEDGHTASLFPGPPPFGTTRA